MTTETVGLVSVVIATHNGIGTIEKAIRSIRSQTYGSIEVIVVDNHSTDGTHEVARGLADAVYQAGPERSGQWNFGARAATGEFLLRTDDDIVFPEGTIREAVTLMRGGATAVSIEVLPNPIVSFWARVRYAEWSCYKYNDLKGIRFLRRQDYLDVGGLNENLTAGEDYDLALRLRRHGIRGVGTKNCAVHLGEPQSLSEVVRKNVYYGKTLRRYFAAEGRSGALMMFPLHKTHFTHRGELVKAGPLVPLGFIIYQYTRYASAAVGLIVAFQA